MEQFIKDNQILDLSDIILFHEDGSWTKNITKETALANGWRVYVDEATDRLVEFALPLLNSSTTVSDNDALEMAAFYNDWSYYIGGAMAAGQICRHGNRLWRVRQDIAVVLETQFPGTDTAALYEVVDKEHEGTEHDPIPYNPPMEIFEGKVYIQDGVMYRCVRSSETALPHNLVDLAGNYVEPCNNR